MQTGLDYLVKGQTIKMDIFKALLDHETEEEVFKREEELAKNDPNFSSG